MTSVSICIPTYNRSRFLEELLDSIIAQNIPEIEVVVSDDASTDDTPVVGSIYSKKIKNFKFIRQPVNIGLDKNFLAVVEAATGDYIWLMGDDDRIERNGARHVLDALNRWPNVSGLTTGVIDYSVDMGRPVGVRSMPSTQILKDVEELFFNISDLLGFMSSLVVNRRRWIEVSMDESTKSFENYYVQVYIIGKIVEKYGNWGVLNEPCVAFRTGNDQFHSKFGWLTRLKIDVEAYDQIASEFLTRGSPAHTMMVKTIFGSHVMARLYNAKKAKIGFYEAIRAAIYLNRYYRKVPRYWLLAVPILIAPSSMVGVARIVFQKLYRNSGAARARAAVAKGASNQV